MATNPVLPISPVLPSFNLPPPMIPTPKRPAHPLPSLDLNLPAPCAKFFQFFLRKNYFLWTTLS
ncbi:Protein CBG03626 [Caenorhabditis briggsae]|uniref:Protein CBG03626 n=1 Tax=Caenorhabditis briggsae TaxID=6238 RepID=A8WVH2_CAEBR|nr:Protein CBG03626 [Caenorhabditis briggsae]CAP24483.1 Protein CBG03626 [Caenorhabditis briggsae]